MNILVCIKQVPGTNNVDVDPVTGVLKRGGIETKMNPYDLYALETALRLREQNGGRVSVISMGPMQAESVIREAFAMGADEGILISDRCFGGADVLATSYTLFQGIRGAGSYDLILCGKQTTDGDTAQVGPELAEWLDIPSVSNVCRIDEVTENGMTVAMDMGRDVEITRICFPCLLSVDKDIYPARLPSYKRKTASRDRKITVYSLDDMPDKNGARYGLDGSPTRVQRIFTPQHEGKRELWKDSAPLLAEALHRKLLELKFI